MVTTEAILLVTFYAIAGRLANAECEFGTKPIEQSTFYNIGGQYLDLNNPATCNRNITSWHYCYYSEGITEDGDYNVWFRIWSSEDGTTYSRQRDDLMSVQLQPQTSSGLICNNFTLPQPIEILQGDIIGVYIPDGNLPNTQPQTPLHITANTANETVYSLYYDTRIRNRPFRRNNVDVNDLMEMRGLALHLYANIDLETQVSPTVTLTSLLSQSSTQPHSSAVSMVVGGSGVPTSGGSLSAGAIAAIIVVVILVMLLSSIFIIVGIIVWKRRRQNLSKERWNSTFSIDNAVYEVPIRGNASPSRKKSTKGAEDYEIPINSKVLETNWSSFEDDPEVDEYEHMEGGESNAPSGTISEQTHQQNIYVESTDLFDIYASFGPTNSEYCKYMEQATSVTGGDKESDLYCAPPTNEEELYEELSNQRIRVIQRESIEITSHLGSGQFANVEKGVWKSPNGITLEVAVKCLSSNTSSLDKIKFLQEAAIMGQFQHPNVVRINGVVMDKETPMLVIEYLSRGALLSCLREMRPEDGELVPANTAQLLLTYSQQIAFGMHYLSSKAFVHRDLAARNIFVSKDSMCKIGDFGMSRDLADAEYYVSQGGTVPVKWTAPEAIYFRKYSIASDIWSYGCLLYEIWSLGCKPFKGYSHTEVLQKLDSGFRLPPPPGCPRVIYELMIKCWHHTPSLRSNFRDLLAVLVDDKDAVLNIPVDDASTNEYASTLGASLEAGKGMYTNLQQVYLSTSTGDVGLSLQESLPSIYTASCDFDAMEGVTGLRENIDQQENIYDEVTETSTLPRPGQTVDDIYSEINDQVDPTDVDYEDI